MWALSYWMVMDVRERAEEKVEELKLQTFNLNYDRFQLLYANRNQGKVFTLDGEEVKGKPITDPAQLDDWFQQLDGMRKISLGDVEFEESRRLV